MGFSICFFAFIHFLVLFLLFLLTLARSRLVSCHDDELAALLLFKESLTLDQYASSDPLAYPKVMSWKQDEEDSNCCSWDGIECDEDTGHVIKLDLTSCFLYGSINSSSTLFHLVHLEWLGLADNHFNQSNIPSAIGNLTRLRHLDLRLSVFSGQIPVEILQLTRLVSLDLSNNYYMELQNPSLSHLAEKLINLKVLGLAWVDISSSIHHILTNLSSLTFLSLESCRLQGELPAKIFELPNLQVLRLQDNHYLVGHLPEFHEKSSPLKQLSLSMTGLSGKIPDSIENLTSLLDLTIRSSFFSGKIPSSFCKLTKLQYLDISFNRFSGELPASLGNLSHLSLLSISGNNFSGLKSNSLHWIAHLNQLTSLDLSELNLVGEIPSVLMNLTQLIELNMETNQLTGPIPCWMMNLDKLSSLYLNNNRLSDHIPVEIRNLTQLKELDFGSNHLEGFIPISIFELKDLRELDLSSNNLRGMVDLNIFFLKLKNLEALVLSLNNLSVLVGTTNINSSLHKFTIIGLASCNLGEFPYFLHNQNQLVSLDLSSNKIAGQVPGWFLNVSTKNLFYLNLSHNLLTGFEQNPLVLSWIRLATLDLRFNKLQGPLPIPSKKISSYLISNNQLIGEVSRCICNLDSLYALDLSYNNLSGMLPECLGNFISDLTVLKLQGNNLNGSIPQTFTHGTNLVMLDLSNNSLQGKIPKSLRNCMELRFLHLGNNNITDIFPYWLGTLPNLEVLVLKFNRFHGVIKEPKTGLEFPKLRIIDLSHNSFTGNLPSKYFQIWNAMKDVNASELIYMHAMLYPASFPQYTPYGFSDFSLTLSTKGNVEYEKLSNLIIAIILSNNKFVGEIPASITTLKGLRYLNLSSNNLEGQIPSSLYNLTVLESLDLSNNDLSGKIPQQLVEITTLAIFDVSNNHLMGSIPQGKQFSTFGINSFDGNPGLCGEILSRKCEKFETSLHEDTHLESHFAFGWEIVLIGYASGTIIGVVIGHIVSTRNPEWLVKTFGLHLKTTQRRKRRRN